MAFIEIIGYIASAFVAISLLMVSIVKLRIYNLIGSVSFIVYGILINSIPIIVTNNFITLINLYFLIKMFRKNTKEFTYLNTNENRKMKLLDYIQEFKTDILKHYPLFNFETLELSFKDEGKVYLALKGFMVVGFSYYVNVSDKLKIDNPSEKEIINYVKTELFPEQTIYLTVDYVTAKYRDIGLVKKLYNEVIRDIDKSKIKFIISINENTNTRHHKFLTSNGYKKEKTFDRFSLYVLSLS